MDYTELTFFITPKIPFTDILTAELAEIGFDSFVETDEGMRAYIPSARFADHQVRSIPLITSPHVKVTWELKNIPDQNWNEVWEKNFTPVVIGDELMIRAPFHARSNKVKHDIVIEPKMSFGTGHHETTWLMAKHLLSLDVKGKNILDMGCGTGLLAILAGQMKAGKLTAIDVDDRAIQNTRENAKRNKVMNIDVEKGDVKLLAGKHFHVILANINKNVLLKDIPSYAEALLPGGDILLSGFFETDAEELIRAGHSCDLHLNERGVRNTWAALHMKKTGL